MEIAEPTHKRALARHELMGKRKKPEYKAGKPLPLENIVPLPNQLIAGLDNRKRDRLALLTHQLAFYANRLHGATQTHSLTKRPTLPQAPAKDLTILIRLACELLDLHEEILFAADSLPPPTQARTRD